MNLENRNANQSGARKFRNKLLPAFWSLGSALSILLNGILLVVVVVLLNQLSTIKQILTTEIVGGLYYNFLLMDQATIRTTIEVQDTIPVQFYLALKENTVVVLTEDTFITGATVTMNTGGLNISSAPTDIILPEGTELPVRLNFTVPVDTEVPISLTVPVNIPLAETELHQPFVGLQEVVAPLFWMLLDTPESWPEATCQYWQISCP
jgi:hypothetical protein